MNKKIISISIISFGIIISGVLIWFFIETSINKKNSDEDDDNSSSIIVLDLRKGRLLGIDVNMAYDNNYDSAFDVAKSVGIDLVTLSFGWDSIETEPYNYTNENIEIANFYYPSKNCKIALIIAPIDTNVDRRPADLKNYALNHTETISRFKDMLYNVSTRLNNVNIISLSIGNEVDVYLDSDPSAWANYTDFFNQTSEYAKDLFPNTKIGCKTTFNALSDTHKNQILQLNNNSDVIMTTYYPLYSDFSVKPLSVIEEDFNNITITYQTRDVYFLEVGFPSNTTLGSSNSTQAAFIEEIFKQWDSHANRIKLITINWLHDRSSEEVNEFCDYYNINDENFKAYLGSLGIRTHYGKDKEAFSSLKTMAKARGW